MLYNSLIYDKIDFASYGVIEKVDRPFLAPINLITNDVMGRDGVLYGTSTLEPLEITAYLRVFDRRSLDRLLNEIAGLLYKKELKPLNFNLNNTWYDAVLKSLTYDERFRSQRALAIITFFVPYPVARSKEMIETESFTDKTFRMGGNYPTKPIFYFTGTDVKITKMSTGEFIQIVSGDSMDFIINCMTETVRKGDVNMMKRLSWQSTFFDMEDGDRIVATKPIKASYYTRYLHNVRG